MSNVEPPAADDGVFAIWGEPDDDELAAAAAVLEQLSSAALTSGRGEQKHEWPSSVRHSWPVLRPEMPSSRW